MLNRDVMEVQSLFQGALSGLGRKLVLPTLHPDYDRTGNDRAKRRVNLKTTHTLSFPSPYLFIEQTV